MKLVERRIAKLERTRTRRNRIDIAAAIYASRQRFAAACAAKGRVQALKDSWVARRLTPGASELGDRLIDARERALLWLTKNEHLQQNDKGA